MFGKWHIGVKGKFHPQYRGFDEAIETSGKHFDFETDPQVDYPKGQYLADFLTDRAIGFIDRNRDRPFFLYLPHFGVHSPHQAKPELIQRFKKKNPIAGHNNPKYAAMIASVDESVGRILDKLDEWNLSENTIVLFASDNGGVGGYVREGIKQDGDITDNFPLRSGKGSLYEGGTRVPLIARWPNKIPADSTCPHPTIHVDLFPTLLEMASAPIPDQPLDGKSLLPLMLEPTSDFDRQAIFQHFPGYLGAGENAWRTTPVSTIQSGPWKLMEFHEDGHLELYNLDRDIGESVNLAATEPDQAQKLHQLLVDWREQIQAPMPTKNDDSSSTTKKPKKARPAEQEPGNVPSS
jgi:arylsulfatase A-like enzyme